MSLEMPYIPPETINAYNKMKGGGMFKSVTHGPPPPTEKPPGPNGVFQTGGATGSILNLVKAPMGPTRPSAS